MSSEHKYCTSCGSALEPGQKFCTSCGTEVPTSSDTSGLDKVIADETAPIAAGSFSASPTMEMNPVEANTPDVTGVMPALDSTARSYSVNYVPEETPAAPESVPSPEPAPAPVQVAGGRSNRTLLIVVIVILVLLVCLLGGLLFGTTMGKMRSAADSSGSVQQEQSKSDSSEGNEVASAGTESKSEEEIYESLKEFHSDLADFDSEIADAATSFNNNYLKKSTSTRSSCSESASELMEEIEDKYADLQKLNVTSASQYFDAFQDLLTCYYDCDMRISVICEAWDISLSYSDPSGHGDEICKPIADDNEGKKNKYKSDFDKLYPTIEIAAPSGE